MGRWSYPNFNPWEWDEFGKNDLTLEARKMVHQNAPLDKEMIHLLILDLEVTRMVIDDLRHRKLKARLRRLFRLKGEK